MGVSLGVVKVWNLLYGQIEFIKVDNTKNFT
jgi:hypothetical protein